MCTLVSSASVIYFKIDGITIFFQKGGASGAKIGFHLVARVGVHLVAEDGDGLPTMENVQFVIILVKSIVVYSCQVLIRIRKSYNSWLKFYSWSKILAIFQISPCFLDLDSLSYVAYFHSQLLKQFPMVKIYAM